MRLTNETLFSIPIITVLGLLIANGTPLSASDCDGQNATFNAQQGLLHARNFSLDGWKSYFITEQSKMCYLSHFCNPKSQDLGCC